MDPVIRYRMLASDATGVSLSTEERADVTLDAGSK